MVSSGPVVVVGYIYCCPIEEKSYTLFLC